jgi:hypothetical protein
MLVHHAAGVLPVPVAFVLAFEEDTSWPFTNGPVLFIEEQRGWDQTTPPPVFVTTPCAIS